MSLQVGFRWASARIRIEEVLAPVPEISDYWNECSMIVGDPWPENR